MEGLKKNTKYLRVASVGPSIKDGISKLCSNLR